MTTKERDHWLSHMRSCTLPLTVVYAQPSDFPSSYVARLLDLDKPTAAMCKSDTLQGLYEMLPLSELMKISRHEDDDPAILETWI